MPQLPVINADPRAAIFTPPRLGPEYFGAGVARSLDAFGQTLFRIGEKSRLAQEELTISQALADLHTSGADLIQKADGSVSGDVYARDVTKQLQDQLQERLKSVSNERTRTIIQAHAAGRIAEYGIRANHAATAQSIRLTQTDALAQLDTLAAQGTPDALEAGSGLVQGLTRYGIFTPEQGDALQDKLKKESVSNAFGRLLEADPQAAFDQVNQRQGIFASVTDAEHKRFLGAARAEQEYQQDRAYVLQQRQHTLETQSREDTERLRLEMANESTAPIVSLAMTDPAAAVERATALGPEGLNILKTAEVEALILRIPAIFAAKSERTDPAVEQTVREDYAGAKRFTPMDLATMTGLSSQSRDQWMSRYEEHRRYVKAEGKSDLALARQQEGQDLSVVYQSINGILRYVDAVGDPALKQRAAQAASIYDELAWKNSTLKGGAGAGAWWNTVGRQQFETQIGRDLDSSEETIDNLLPPNVRTVEDLAALKAVKGWSDTSPEYQRNITLLRKKGQARKTKELLKVQKEVQEAVKIGREAMKRGEVPGEISQEQYNNTLWELKAIGGGE